MIVLTTTFNPVAAWRTGSRLPNLDVRPRKIQMSPICVSLNMNIRIIAVVITLFLSIHLFAGTFIKPESILGTAELCISDGSSVYIFSPDNKFRLVPIGESGRTIEGTWSRDSEGIHIVGKWSWINGLSANDDFREMDIYIGALQDKTREYTSMFPASKHKIYDCYFLIERVEKKKRGESGPRE